MVETANDGLIRGRLPLDHVLVVNQSTPGTETLGQIPIAHFAKSAPLALFDIWYYATITKTGALGNDDVWSATALATGSNTTALPARNDFAQGGVFIRSSATAGSGYRYNSAWAYLVGARSNKFRAQFMWLTSFTNRIGFFGMNNTNNIDTTDNHIAAFYQNGDQIYGRIKRSGVGETNTSSYTLSLGVVYTFERDINAAGTECRFRIFADQNETPVFDQTLTANVPISKSGGDKIIVRHDGAAISDIGILYSVGQGTIEAYERWRWAA